MIDFQKYLNRDCVVKDVFGNTYLGTVHKKIHNPGSKSTMALTLYSVDRWIRVLAKDVTEIHLSEDYIEPGQEEK